jgi:hypothetical protein
MPDKSLKRLKPPSVSSSRLKPGVNKSPASKKILILHQVWIPQFVLSL